MGGGSFFYKEIRRVGMRAWFMANLFFWQSLSSWNPRAWAQLHLQPCASRIFPCNDNARPLRRRKKWVSALQSASSISTRGIDSFYYISTTRARTGILTFILIFFYTPLPPITHSTNQSTGRQAAVSFLFLFLFSIVFRGFWRGGVGDAYHNPSLHTGVNCYIVSKGESFFARSRR